MGNYEYHTVVITDNLTAANLVRNSWILDFEKAENKGILERIKRLLELRKKKSGGLETIHIIHTYSHVESRLKNKEMKLEKIRKIQNNQEYIGRYCKELLEEEVELPWMVEYIERGNNSADQLAGDLAKSKEVYVVNSPAYMWKCREECILYWTPRIDMGRMRIQEYRLQGKWGKKIRNEYRKGKREKIEKKLPWSLDEEAKVRKEKINGVFTTTKRVKNNRVEILRLKLISGMLPTNNRVHKYMAGQTNKEKKIREEFREENRSILLSGLNTIERRKKMKEMRKKIRIEEIEEIEGIEIELWEKKIEKIKRRTKRVVKSEKREQLWGEMVEEMKGDLRIWKKQGELVDGLDELQTIEEWTKMKLGKTIIEKTKKKEEEIKYIKRKDHYRLKYNSPYCEDCLSYDGGEFEVNEDEKHIFGECPAGEEMRRRLDEEIKEIGQRNGLGENIWIFPPYRNEEWRVIVGGEEENRRYIGRYDEKNFKPEWAWYGAIPDRLYDELMIRVKRKDIVESMIEEIRKKILMYAKVIYMNRCDRKEKWTKRREKRDRIRKMRRHMTLNPD